MDNKINIRNIDDLVFEGRNQSYGAYVLRKLYDKHMSKANLIATLFFVLAIASPVIYKYISGWIPEKVEQLDMKEVTLAEPPSVEKKPPPPPPPKIPPPPVKATIKFVPPKVKKDEEVRNEEPPPKVEDITVQVATKTQEGDDKGPDIGVIEKTEAPPVVEEPEDKVFDFVQQSPEFPDGGTAAMQQFLRANIKYPPMAKENHIEGKVFVSFVVGKDGSISNVQVVRGIAGGDAGIHNEAVRVVKAMPKWRPGKNNGVPVSCKFTIPINFKLE